MMPATTRKSIWHLPLNRNLGALALAATAGAIEILRNFGWKWTALIGIVIVIGLSAEFISRTVRGRDEFERNIERWAYAIAGGLTVGVAVLMPFFKPVADRLFELSGPALGPAFFLSIYLFGAAGASTWLHRRFENPNPPDVGFDLGGR